jgi:putative oxidoreductase
MHLQLLKDCNMNDNSVRPQPLFIESPAVRLFTRVTAILVSIAIVLAPLFLRAALAVPFFKSGLTRWDGFLSLSPSTLFLFADMFKLHILGGEYPIPMPLVTAHLVGIAEIALPILLVIGFATRYVALGLLIMTGIIQLVVPEGWANFHLPWASIALAIIALGAGPLSVDGAIAWILGQKRPLKLGTRLTPNNGGGSIRIHKKGQERTRPW